MNEVRQIGPEEAPQAQFSVPSTLLMQAKELGVDVPRADSDGIRRAVMNELAWRHAEANRESVDAWNEYVAKNGMPFDDIMEQPV